MHGDKSRVMTTCVHCGSACSQRIGAKHPACCMACRRPGDPETRFWRFVNKTDSCWLWTSALNEHGYGVFHNPGGERLAHRFSLSLVIGPIPSALGVLHDCPDGDLPACVRPDHLWCGDQDANMGDAAFKERTSRGEHRPNAKLTELEVREIRRLYTTRTWSQRDLGVLFRISHQVISDILNGHTWRHV